MQYTAMNPPLIKSEIKPSNGGRLGQLHPIPHQGGHLVMVITQWCKRLSLDDEGLCLYHYHTESYEANVKAHLPQ